NREGKEHYLAKGSIDEISLYSVDFDSGSLREKHNGNISFLMIVVKHGRNPQLQFRLKMQQQKHKWLN
ncbi:hypothetical protein, partial [Streptococcus pneumoniae]|uniref:hypothetical protein n=1 Tax=Streptococcus pneumoniae TaxID=1313 RepID=UPI000B2D9D90